MKIKGIVDEDFVNFKTCSLFLAFPTCSWKCGNEYCQNSALAHAEEITVTNLELRERYERNPLSQAIVCGGLEPFDSFRDLYMLIVDFRRNHIDDPFVIYTGYERTEIEEYVKTLKQLGNIIIKFGRYLPGQESHFDNILGVTLASNNQYAEVIA